MVHPGRILRLQQRERGADGGKDQVFLSSMEFCSLRLQPRKDALILLRTTLNGLLEKMMRMKMCIWANETWALIHSGY